MKTLGKIRKRLKNKKGFTLIELIVVIVIIGILAALLVPSVLRYIDKAKTRQVMADGRTLFTAAQGVLAEEYEDGNVIDNVDIEVPANGVEEDVADKIEDDAGVARDYIATIGVTDNSVSSFSIEEGSMTYYYDMTKGTWTDVEPGTP